MSSKSAITTGAPAWAVRGRPVGRDGWTNCSVWVWVCLPGEDPCAKEELEDYQLGLHIGSVFILLGVSLLGSFLPVILQVSSKNTATQTVIK